MFKFYHLKLRKLIHSARWGVCWKTCSVLFNSKGHQREIKNHNSLQKMTTQNSVTPGIKMSPKINNKGYLKQKCQSSEKCVHFQALNTRLGFLLQELLQSSQPKKTPNIRVSTFYFHFTISFYCPSFMIIKIARKESSISFTSSLMNHFLKRATNTFSQYWFFFF